MPTITGTSGADTLEGTADADEILGLDGNDNLSGGDGNDTLDGGAGSDILTGGAGDDLLILDRYDRGYGNDGADTFNIQGDVEVDGGDGADVFNVTDTLGTPAYLRLGAGADTINLSTNTSVRIQVVDFQMGSGGDTINIDPQFFTGWDSSLNPYTNGYVRVFQGTTATIIWFDNDGGFDSFRPVASLQHAVQAPTAAGNILVDGVSWPFVNTITGTSSDDDLSGTPSLDEISGLGGNDTIRGGDGDDVLYGGDGNDSIEGGNGYDNMSGGDGDDTLRSGADATMDTLDGGDGNDWLYGGRGGGSFYGGAGNDFLDAGSVSATLVGGSGDDIYVIRDGIFNRITESADGGHDTIQAMVSLDMGRFDNVEDVVYVGPGAFSVTGNALANVITGGSGADTITGGLGGDTLIGGDGDDRYRVQDGSSVTIIEAAAGGIDVIVAAGTFSLAGFANVENLLAGSTTSGSAGNFTGYGNDLNNRIEGSYQNDYLDGGIGADTLVGDEGNDTYVVDNVGDVVIEQPLSGNSGIDTVLTSLNTFSLATLYQVENLTFTGAGAFAGVGNNQFNRITGGDSHDLLEGGAGNDTLIGGAGNDTLDGGTETDSMAGGSGDDTYIVDSGTDVISEDASAGTDLVRSSVTYTLGATLENLTLTGILNINGTGNAFGNALTGNNGSNRLDGGFGADTMIGGGGNDTYIVDDAGDTVTELENGGADSVNTSLNSYTLGDFVEYLTFTGSGNFVGTGNALQNIIRGGSGNDTLDGGAGLGDELIGGLGDDTYYIRNINTHATEYLGQGTDVVYATFSGYTLDAGVENLFLVGNGFTATGNSLHNTITGTDGADTIDGASGLDTMIGGAGNDTYVVDNLGDVVTESSGGGIDTVRVSVSGYTLAANAENLTLLSGAASGAGNALDNILTGNISENTLNGGAGADTMIGGIGNDTYLVDNALDVVTELSGEGTDTIQTVLTSYSLGAIANVEKLVFTGVGNFSGTGNALNNTLTGGAGNDILDGGSGGDAMYGGAGDDTYIVDSISDAVIEYAGEGVDTVRTNLSSYSVAASANIENIFYTGTNAFSGSGNSSANAITSGNGDDTLDGGVGADTLSGGAGDDTYIVDYALDQVIEGASAGTDTIRTSVSVYSIASLSNIENLAFIGAGGFRGTGNASANILTGGAGSDTLTGGGGNDSLAGGTGFDTAAFSGAIANYTITDLGNGSYSVADLRGGAPDGTDTLTGIDSLQFTDGTITLAGSEKMPQALVGPLSWLTAGSVTNSNWASFSEVDAYRVVLQAGYTYTFTLTDTSGGRDTFLSLLDANLNLVTYNDDVSLFNLNSSFTYTATSSGEYYLVAEELYGDTGSYSLTYRNLTGSDSILSNASTNRTIVVGGSSQTEWVEIAGDHDWYRVSLTAGQSYAFSLTGSGGAALSDPFLALRDSAGALIAIDDDGGAGTNSLLRFTATSSGTYYLDVSAYAQETGEYTLSAATGPAQNPLDTLDLGFTINHSNISVYFATGGQSFTSAFAGSETASRSWTSGEIAAAFAALNSISAVANLTFTQVGSSVGADFIMSLADLSSAGALGLTYTNGGTQALIEFDPFGTGWSSGLQSGGYGFITLVHEIGHALGLDHPHYDGGDNQVMQGVLDSFYSYGTFQLDQGVYTTMGYNDGWPAGPLGVSATNNYGWQSGPMALDIAALQQAYGANATTNSTDTTYTLAATNTTGTSYQAIWDTGGTDTIAYSGSGNAVIDLRAATLQNAVGGGGYVSYVSGVIGGYTIANGAVIENASGGNGADYLIGNAAANTLSGGGGADRLNGGTGLNTLSGGSGIDTVDYSWTTLGARIDFGAGSNQGQSIGGGAEAFTDQLSGIERALGGSGADIFVIRSVTPGTVLGFYAGTGSDTADFSLFTSAIWIDLSYQVNDVWTRDTSALTSGTWRAIADLDGVERIVGTVYSDYVAGDAQDNTYVYNGGSDSIDLRGGIDTVDFSTFTSAVWVDLNYGDNDAWTRDAADLSIGTWRPIATLTNVENLIGSVYSDALYGNATTRLLSGGGGNDALYVRGVQSGVVASFDGGTGIDTLDFSSFRAAVWVHLDYSGAEAWTRDNAGVTSGTWRAIGDLTSIENLTGSAYNDDLAGNASNNTFQYTGGFDLIDGQGGIDVVDFSRFNAAVWMDLAYAGAEAWTRDGQTLAAGGWRAIADVTNIEGAAGTQWNDQLSGSSGANVLLGGAGADEIEGRGGGDILDGGEDVDTLKYTLSASAVTINLATNSASGGDATGDTISNFENVIGSVGNDSLTGNSFDNVLDGGVGADTLTGGAGNDIYLVDNANDVVVEALNEGRDLVRATAASYTMAANVENYERVGTAGYAVTGNGVDNVFFMSAITNGQIATINGGAHGALGDTVDFSGFGAAVWVDLTYGGAPAEAWTRDTAGLTTGTYRGIADLSGIENIIGTLGDDHLVGDASDNVISYYGYLGAINGATSFGGRDYIDGGVGSDTADFSRINTGGIWIDLTYAGPEAWQQDFFGNWRVLADLDRIENLRGTDFNDTLRGDGGNNIINGLGGNDLMTGGGGADAFVVGNANFNLPGVLGQIDTITDFAVGEDDIWLTLVNFSAFGSTGVISANHFVIGAAAVDSDDWLIYNAGTGALFYDEDGNGATSAVQFANLSPNLLLTNADFLIV